MRFELNDNEVRLYESGPIHTRMEIGEHEIIDEFYPLCGNTTQTVIDNIVLQPNTYRKRVIENTGKEPKRLIKK